jgi:hypothetical protein
MEGLTDRFNQVKSVGSFRLLHLITKKSSKTFGIDPNSEGKVFFDLEDLITNSTPDSQNLASHGFQCFMRSEAISDLEREYPIYPGKRKFLTILPTEIFRTDLIYREAGRRHKVTRHNLRFP